MQEEIHVRRPQSAIVTVNAEAYQVVDKTVKRSGNSGGVYLPKEWVGKRVKVLLLEDPY